MIGVMSLKRKVNVWFFQVLLNTLKNRMFPWTSLYCVLFPLTLKLCS